MKGLTVGVVIPAYNAEHWLAQALASVARQARAPEDVLVVDDGSADATAEIAECFGGAVRVVRQENGGIGAARNRGVELVRGEVIAMLDADDMFTLQSIATRVAVLEEHPEVGLVFGHEQRFEQVDEDMPVALGELLPSQVPGSMLVRRDAMERVGSFATGVRVAEGLDWLLRAREQYIAEVTVEEQILWRRVHAANNSRSHRTDMGEFAVAIKASLDRRRAAGVIAPRERS